MAISSVRTKGALKAVKKAGLALVQAKTPEACENYNALIAAGDQGAILAHGTC